VDSTPLHPGDALAPPPSRRRGLPPLAWAAAVLLLGLACTAIIAHREWRDLQQRTEDARRALADAGAARLRVPLEQAASMLRAMQTVFLANDQMDQARFSQYHASLRSPLAPGTYTSMAFARRSPADQPLADQVSYRYEFVAPYQHNTSLVGFDMVTQKANLAALLRARDTDTVVISAPFALRQTTPAGQNPLGVTLRLPVYSDGPTPTSPNQRRAREIGALAIGIRVQPLVEAAMAGTVLDAFRVRVYDATAGAHPFYDSSSPVAGGLAGAVRRRSAGWTSAAGNGASTCSRARNRWTPAACRPSSRAVASSACCWRRWRGRWPPRADARWRWANR
jgi:CHASE1-domain containing sensor protein